MLTCCGRSVAAVTISLHAAAADCSAGFGRTTPLSSRAGSTDFIPRKAVMQARSAAAPVSAVWELGSIPTKPGPSPPPLIVSPPDSQLRPGGGGASHPTPAPGVGEADQG